KKQKVIVEESSRSNGEEPQIEKPVAKISRPDVVEHYKVQEQREEGINKVNEKQEKVITAATPVQHETESSHTEQVQPVHHEVPTQVDQTEGFNTEAQHIPITEADKQIVVYVDSDMNSQ
ncbi:hypothetical protein A2U01_0061854, partial [Trifolium medium]|nr:hypothetical protein [Trifolium medium]